MRAVTLFALLSLALAGCGATSSEVVTSSETSETTPTTSSPSSGRPAAPPIRGVTLDGQQVSLADFRGKAVFVNVWSSW
ncbi:MAG: hypothetical protein H0U82_00865 [Actinobacteria bacterium]|nr:hypothetical protein [Actinomycetota bacterium]